jgi:hypothetical protein
MYTLYYDSIVSFQYYIATDGECITWSDFYMDHISNTHFLQTILKSP